MAEEEEKARIQKVSDFETLRAGVYPDRGVWGWNDLKATERCVAFVLRLHTEATRCGSLCNSCSTALCSPTGRRAETDVDDARRN